MSSNNNNNNAMKTPSKKAGLSPVKRNRSSPGGDRFIPNRATMNFEMAHFNITSNMSKENDNGSQVPSTPITPSKSLYKATLANAMLNGNEPSNRILTLQSRAPAPPVGFVNPLKALYSQNKIADYSPKKKVTRLIPQAPEKVGCFFLGWLPSKKR